MDRASAWITAGSETASINSTAGNFAFNMREAGVAEVIVYNERGNRAAEEKLAFPAGPGLLTIPLQRFAPGVYLYRTRLSYNSGNSEASKIVKFLVAK